MSRLTFYYGTVSAAKSAHLLAAYYAYKAHDKKSAWLLKSSVDTRNGAEMVWSRVPGLQQKADLVVHPEEDIPLPPAHIQCIFVDEVQFFTPTQVNQLWRASLNVPVMCYGLRANYLQQPFPGSARLMLLAERMIALERVCYHCNHQASQNLKLQKSGAPQLKGSGDIELGTEKLYVPVCKWCLHQYKHT